jgi:hypothetical protein
VHDEGSAKTTDYAGPGTQTRDPGLRGGVFLEECFTWHWFNVELPLLNSGENQSPIHPVDRGGKFEANGGIPGQREGQTICSLHDQNATHESSSCRRANHAWLMVVMRGRILDFWRSSRMWATKLRKSWY